MMVLKVKVISYDCKGWCTGKTGEAKRYALPDPGYLVKFKGACPHKGMGNGVTTYTACFIEDSLSKVEVIEQ